MIRLNLLPDVRHESESAQQTHSTFLRAIQALTLLLVAMTALLLVWVYGVQGLHRALLDRSIASRYQQLRAVKDLDTYATVQNQLSALPQLHANKNLTSRLLDYLPSLNSGVTLKKVTFNGDKRTLVFEGEAVDYRRLVIFRDTLRSATLSYKTAAAKPHNQPFVSLVTLDKSAVHLRDTTSYVAFQITARYQDAAFKALAFRPTLTISKKETTPSVLATPLVSEGGLQP